MVMAHILAQTGADDATTTAGGSILVMVIFFAALAGLAYVLWRTRTRALAEIEERKQIEREQHSSEPE